MSGWQARVLNPTALLCEFYAGTLLIEVADPPRDSSEDGRMYVADDVIPFPLYHGTSGHYLSAFKPGRPPAAWPHKNDALRLLEDAWNTLSSRRHEVPNDIREYLRWDIRYEDMPWVVAQIIEQNSGHSNFQHGELYLSINMGTALSYGCAGARYGGELLTYCKTAIDVMATIDPDRSKELVAATESLEEFFRGTECPPLLVEFDEVRVGELSTEVAGQDVRHRLSLMTNELSRKVVGQQTNFRLAKGCGIVSRVFEVNVVDVDCYCFGDPFELTEISSFD